MFWAWCCSPFKFMNWKWRVKYPNLNMKLERELSYSFLHCAFVVSFTHFPGVVHLGVRRLTAWLGVGRRLAERVFWRLAVLVVVLLLLRWIMLLERILIIWRPTGLLVIGITWTILKCCILVVILQEIGRVYLVLATTGVSSATLLALVVWRRLVIWGVQTTMLLFNHY